MKITNIKEVSLNKNSVRPITFAHMKTYTHDLENFRLHISRYCEAYIYVAGEASYVVEDNIYSLKPGDIIIIKPNEVHKPIIVKGCWYERFYILFPLDAFNYYNDYDGRLAPLNCFINRDPGGGNLISLPEKERNEILSLLYETDEILSRQEPEDIKGVNLLFHSHMLKFLHTINSYYYRHYGNAVNTGVLRPGSGTKFAGNMPMPQIITDILIYINMELQNINNMSEIAHHFYISTPYLSTLFKKYMNINISSYVQTKRIARAKILLGEGSSVTEASIESGFNNSSHFISVFKKIVGTTPHKFKNKQPE